MESPACLRRATSRPPDGDHRVGPAEDRGLDTVLLSPVEGVDRRRQGSTARQLRSQRQDLVGWLRLWYEETSYHVGVVPCLQPRSRSRSRKSCWSASIAWWNSGSFRIGVVRFRRHCARSWNGWIEVGSPASARSSTRPLNGRWRTRGWRTTSRNGQNSEGRRRVGRLESGGRP